MSSSARVGRFARAIETPIPNCGECTFGPISLLHSAASLNARGPAKIYNSVLRLARTFKELLRRTSVSPPESASVAMRVSAYSQQDKH